MRIFFVGYAYDKKLGADINNKAIIDIDTISYIEPVYIRKGDENCSDYYGFAVGIINRKHPIQVYFRDAAEVHKEHSDLCAAVLCQRRTTAYKLIQFISKK